MVRNRRLLTTTSPRSASPLRWGGRAASPVPRLPVRGAAGHRGLGAGSPLLPRPHRRPLLPSRSLSLDTGLDTSSAVASDSETATDVVNSCEQYLQQQQQQPRPQYLQQGPETRSPRRRLSSIPCESSPIAEEENIVEEETSQPNSMDGDFRGSREDSYLFDPSLKSSPSSSQRSSIASADDLYRKSSFVNKCMTRVRGFIKK